MKKSRFTEEQMVAILREADKAPAPEVARKHKVSAHAIYTWRRRFGELQPADVRRLRQLEIENAKLKKLVAERDLEIDTMIEIAHLAFDAAGSIRSGGVIEVLKRAW